MNVFYINNDKVRAINVAPSAKKIKVNSFCAVDFANEFLDEPTQERIDVQMTEAMLNLIRSNNIKGGATQFVLDNVKIPFREMIMPSVKEKNLLPLLQTELFSDKKMIATNTIDYVEIERDIDEQHQNRLMVTYIDSAIIENLKKCCKDVSLTIKGINIIQNSMAKLMWFMRDDLPENFVLVDYHSTYATTYLFSQTKHLFSMTKAIYSTPNESFSNEMAFFVNDFSVQISEAISFFMQKYTDATFDTVFVTGETAKLESCIPSVSAYVKMQVKILPQPWGVTGLELHEFNEYSGLIGCSVVRG